MPKPKPRIVWALRKPDGSYILSPGTAWLAPMAYSSREEARTSASQFRNHMMPCKPVRVRVDVRVTEVTPDA
jgi:hypothetical protein